MKQTIKIRSTLKVMVDETAPWPCPAGNGRELLVELMDYGSWAPFHYECHSSHRQGPQDSPVPWRFHALDTPTCRELLRRLREQEIQTGKIGGMLAAATGMIMATWLPDPVSSKDLAEGSANGVTPPEFQSFAPTLRNMEHIAAASAAIQNVLLVATENQLHNYWSSGGKLRSEQVYEWLEIPKNQVLLGAIFVFPQQTSGAVTKTGAWRNKRGERSRWSRGVVLTQPTDQADAPDARQSDTASSAPSEKKADDR